MFTWLKNKAIAIWNWFKRQWKKIAIGTVVASTLVGAELLTPEQILPDHQLKADKTKILESQEVDWIDSKTGENKGKIIKYVYVKDEVQPLAYGSLSEITEMRTSGAQFWKKGEQTSKGIKTTTMVTKMAVGGAVRVQEGNKWFEVGFATTTIDAFKKQTTGKFGITTAYAITTTTWIGAKDASARRGDQASWAAARDADTAVDILQTFYMSVWAMNSFTVHRAFLPIPDTAGLPANIVVSSSTLVFFLRDGAGDRTWEIVHTTNDPTETLAVANFDDIDGYADATSIAASNRGGSLTILGASNDNAWRDIALDSDGLSWIKGATTTRLGLWDSLDLDYTSPPDGADHYLDSSASTLGRFPYLLIEYTIASTAVPEPDQIPLILFE